MPPQASCGGDDQRAVPPQVVVCTIYYLDPTPGGSWADFVLSKMGYDDHPEKLQAAVPAAIPSSCHEHPPPLSHLTLTLALPLIYPCTLVTQCTAVPQWVTLGLMNSLPDNYPCPHPDSHPHSALTPSRAEPGGHHSHLRARTPDHC